MVLDYIYEILKVVTEGGEQIMKKIMIISMAIVFALGIGVAYAGDMYGDMSKVDNGITIFSASPVSTGTNFRTAVIEWSNASKLVHPEELALGNGATLFEASAVSTGIEYRKGKVMSSEEGMAAGGYEGEPAALELHNGITIFSVSPVSTGINYRPIGE
jgi:hypothetical protein